ncbi:MAG: DnaJ domain-containing protein [Methylotenera sp.]
MALNQDNLESGASLVKLALANYRAQLVNLPESEHADDAQLLLRLANEDQAVVEWASALTGADSSELQKSAIYYIEHQCFGIASDFYGILALNPWATLDDLKTHYRLLIRIFHPDRGFVSEQLAEKYSAMINQAYAALKNTMPVQAKITDATTKPRKGISKFVQEELKAARAQRYWFRLIDLNQIRWFTPGKILLGFAAIAASSIYYFVMPETVATSTFQVMRSGNQGGLGYYDDEPIVTGSTGSANVRSEVENTAIKLSQLESRNVDKVFTESSKTVVTSELDTPTQNQSKLNEMQANGMVAKDVQTKDIQTKDSQIKELQVKPAEVPIQQTTTLPAASRQATLQAIKSAPETPLPSVKLNESKRISTAAVKTDVATQKPAAEMFKPLQPAATAATPKTIITKADSAKIDSTKPDTSTSAKPIEAAPQVAAASKPVAAVVPNQKPDEAPAADAVASTGELRKLVFMFVDGYQRGDIQTFMQVFTEDVQSDEGAGRDNLQQAYIDVFNTTTDREMLVKNMHWVQQEQQMIGNATYEVKIRRNEHTKIKTVTGKLRLDVKKVNNQSKINGFYYVADR